MQYLKNKNMIIEGIEATGKTTLVQNLKNIFPFSIIQPSNYLDDSEELFMSYRVLLDIHSGLLFDRYFITRSVLKNDNKSLYNNLLSSKNRLIFLECDYKKLIDRMSESKKGKFIYKSYSIADLPFIAEDMRKIYDKFEQAYPDYCLRINTGINDEKQTLEKVIEFAKR